MEISKRLWLSLFCTLDATNDLDSIGTSEGGVTYYAERSDVVLWHSDEVYHIEDGEDFDGELPKPRDLNPRWHA